MQSRFWDNLIQSVLEMQDNNSQVQIDWSSQFCRSYSDMSQILFDLDCDAKLIIFSKPCFEVFDYTTGKLLLDKILFRFYDEGLCCNPILKVQNQLLAIYTQEDQIQIVKNQQYYPINYQDACQYELTQAYYDLDKNIYILITGQQKQILIKNIFTNNILFLYKTTSQFDNNSVYYFKENQNLIVIDNTPTIYLCNCLTNEVTLFKIQVYQTKGIIMDEKKNIIFLYSDKFIHIYKFPSMTFIESFSLKLQEETPIQNIYLNTQFNLLNVLTEKALISFDLTEVLYSSEVNLAQYQNIQNIVLNDSYQVYYSLSNYCINLFKQAVQVDYLVLLQDQYNIHPYFTELIQISTKQIMYILFDNFFLIEVDLLKEKLQLIQKIQLSQNPDNYFYDKPRQQILILYQQNLQLSQINLQAQQINEVNFANLPQSDFSQALIIGDFIVLPSVNIVYTFNISTKIINDVNLQNTSAFQFMFKLQSKDIKNYQSSWWKIPFEYEDRYNTSDYIESNQSTSLVCIVSLDSQNTIIQILNVNTNLFQQLLLQETTITNIVNDPFRKIIYTVLNKGITNIYDWNLNFISSLFNPCLKQAIITFDSNFIYSVCPTDIIIYNGLSFQQQFPVINYGIEEATNMISINFNNYFIIIQKEQIYLIQLQYNSNYKILFQKQGRYYQVQVLQLIKSQDEEYSLLIILSSQSDIEKIVIPLSPNNKYHYLNKYLNKLRLVNNYL
ncbi:hypothetical protein TTHERM_00901750 (macronuclear) [Tetrahymena thermophila SB210]|uniref:Uncharacterized protein n=1 Tax=Tetrahymena thermophila (strain SB210) TaxID=312017 RepID=Q24GC4_TETTS|nr:hypothetical protein TTHERM_00901750 [Tetrahymena thermophila SB210]EAS06806.2 hypothetical protein TTHERM_00901750 [Tetrahymena thermophila SB210]|eukprot:XP_001027048.2 hypothetical protein TTHERM_00901750 [Tetrahymena thermophila SB210]